MVKKKGKSKRTTLKDKYKIQRRIVETHRKRKKQAKKDGGRVIQKAKDPGIPNSWPFKQDLLKEIQRSRERQQQLQQEKRERRKSELRTLQEHQERGGTARTVQELMEQAARDRQGFVDDAEVFERERSDGTVVAGQQSRRAYLKELKKVIETSDVLLQVLDARDPIGSRIHSSVENAILSYADKRMVLVLNKIDLVPKTIVADWLTTLRRAHPTVAIKAGTERCFSSGNNNTTTETTTAGSSSSVPVGMDGLLQLLKNYARTGGTGGKNKTTIVVGVIGYPNVGKSSIINALKRSRAVGVSAKPGSTTSMKEVVLDRNVRLVDCPGIVFNDNSNNNTTVLSGIDGESVNDPIPMVESILKRCDTSSLIMTYNIPAFPPGDVMIFLAMVAKSYGRVLKGGIPDKVAAARNVLRDWNNGKIPYYTAPPPPLAAAAANKTTTTSSSSSSENAVILNRLGDEFDLSKFDQQVLNDLKDTDEMDFVQLKNTTDENDDNNNNNSKKNNKKASAAIAAVKMLTGEEDEEDEDDESDDDEDEMDVDDEDVAKARLIEAEDYNFDEM